MFRIICGDVDSEATLNGKGGERRTVKRENIRKSAFLCQVLNSS